MTGSATVEPHSIYDGMASFYRFYNEQPVSPLIADNASIDKVFNWRPVSFEQWAQRQDWADISDPALKIRMAGLR